MDNRAIPRITKSDFLLYCQAPRHLWARKNNRIDLSLSDFDRYLAAQGYHVEELAQEYLNTVIIRPNPGFKMDWQSVVTDGPFEARLDALIRLPHAADCDLYEIKSSTTVDEEDMLDITFQASILKKRISIRRYYILHLNRDYIRCGELRLDALFVAEDVTAKVEELLPEIIQLRTEALSAAQTSDPASLAHCLTPKECPCPEICHPNLPEFSIYDIPRLTQQKKQELLRMRILEAKTIPPSFALNAKQRLIAGLAKTGSVHIDLDAMRAELGRLAYPLYFLDYETCITAVPRYEGYHPQQQIVFQYSLHRMAEPGAQVTHAEFISIGVDDPVPALLEHLCAHIGESGTVIVWNKAFEMAMNREMAKLCPRHALFLEELNARIYDLGDMVNQGYYLHPGFKGSWSIKKVLPVMVPDLSYDRDAIDRGDQASVAWCNLCFGLLCEEEKAQLTQELLQYCELDTLAMVRIFEVFRGMVSCDGLFPCQARFYH